MKNPFKIVPSFMVISASAFIPNWAHAQTTSSVSIYGLIDTGVEYVNNIGTKKNNVTRLPSASNSAPSRIGVRGSEDIKNGLRAIFTLEMGMDPGNGILLQGGRAFGRQAFVGLQGNFGAITIGRIYTMTFWSGLDADLHGSGIYGTSSLDSYIPNARADNAIGYMYRSNGLALGATYSFGRDVVNAGPSPSGTNCPGEVAGDSKSCREWSVMAKYDSSTWGIAAANDRIHGSAAGSVFAGLNKANDTHNRLILNGWIKAGNTKIGAGVTRHTKDGGFGPGNNARRGHLWFLGFMQPVTSFLDISAQWAGMRYSGVSGFNSDIFSLRGTYTLSKRTSTFAQLGYMNNDKNAALQVSAGTPGSAPAQGRNQLGINIGMQHKF